MLLCGWCVSRVKKEKYRDILFYKIMQCFFAKWFSLKKAAKNMYIYKLAAILVGLRLGKNEKR